MFAHHEVRAGLGAAVTDRRGGVSVGAWDSLNLADHVGDDPSAVIENRRRVVAALGPAAGSLVTMRQVHGSSVAVVEDRPDQPPTVDALVTRTARLTLAVMVADCTPVLLWDGRARVVAAAHVGRRGLAAGVLAATIAAMRDLGARDERVAAVVGPAICAEHYEVPEAMRAEVEAAAPGSAALTAAGRPALDIRAGVLRQLGDEGVRRHVVLPQCTAESPSCYSYRRDGVTGRFAGLVWLEP